MNTRAEATATGAATSVVQQRWLGLLVLLVLVVCSALWLAWLQVADGDASVRQLDGVGSRDGVTASRFRADMWFLPDDKLLGFVEIPAGTFVMGSDPATDLLAYDNERWSQQARQAEVLLPTFYIGRYEVTIGQFRQFAAATDYKHSEAGLKKGPDFPATYVSWTDALAYGRWLQQQLMQSTTTPAPLAALLNAGWHITLPNEAQWEKAARGTTGKIYPWGSVAEKTKANYRSAGTTVVGDHACAECSYGLADMSGNVWEFTRSPYRPYPFAESINQSQLATDALWVMRGGSFSDAENNIRAAVRGGIDPSVRNANTGFRLVLEKN